MIKGYYNGLQGIYFNKVIKTIIKIGKLDITNKNILDFGCGLGQLKKKLGYKKNIINYDINPNFTEINNWEDVEFDYFVSNQVFYQLTMFELDQILKKLKSKNPGINLIVGISKRSILNKIGKILLFKFDAHKNTKLNKKDELSILLKHFKIVEHKSVFFLSDIYLLKKK